MMDNRKPAEYEIEQLKRKLNQTIEERDRAMSNCHELWKRLNSLLSLAAASTALDQTYPRSSGLPTSPSDSYDSRSKSTSPNSSAASLNDSLLSSATTATNNTSTINNTTNTTNNNNSSSTTNNISNSTTTASSKQQINTINNINNNNTNTNNNASINAKQQLQQQQTASNNISSGQIIPINLKRPIEAISSQLNNTINSSHNNTTNSKNLHSSSSSTASSTSSLSSSQSSLSSSSTSASKATHNHQSHLTNNNNHHHLSTQPILSNKLDNVSCNVGMNGNAVNGGRSPAKNGIVGSAAASLLPDKNINHPLIVEVPKDLHQTVGEIVEISPGQFKCRYCEKTFDRIFSVHRHERVHTGYKPCKCNECGRGFSEKRNLRHHIIRFHSDGSGRELLKRNRNKMGGHVGTPTSPSKHQFLHHHHHNQQASFDNQEFVNQLRAQLPASIKDELIDTSGLSALGAAAAVITVTDSSSSSRRRKSKPSKKIILN